MSNNLESELNELKQAIKLELSELEPCRKKADYTITKETMGKELEFLIKEFRKMAQVPGFRKGKAPSAIIKNRFMDQIKEELIRRFYTAAFEKATKDENLEVVSYTMDDEDKKPELDWDKDFSFAINFDVEPDFEVPGYKGLKIDTPAVEIEEKEISERMDYFKDMYAEYKTLDIPAEKGDMLKVAYSSDFELPEGASASLERQVKSDEGWIWLSDPEMIPGAIKALTGAEKDKEYDFESEYPADYRESELAGKKLNYKVKVQEVQRRAPLESEEQLCEKMRVENIDALKEQIEKSLKAEKERQNRQLIGDSIYEQISSKIDDFPIPPSVFSSETNKELRNMANQTVKSEEDAKKFQDEKDIHLKDAKEAAKSRMRRMFILKKIAKAEDITVEQEEMARQIKSMSGYYGMKESNLLKMMQQTGGIEDMQLDMMAAKVTDFLIENAELVEAKQAKKDKSEK
jgi:trigger factor